jgi:hypothetical protein
MRYDRVLEPSFSSWRWIRRQLFPKDTKALTYLAQQHGAQLKTVDAAVENNAKQKTAPL